MNKKSRNKGFSLIEIIVTIAIMAIVTGTSVSIYSWVRSHRMQEIAGNISDAIGEVRSDTLSKSGTYELVIKKSSDKFVASVTHNSETINRTISSRGTVSAVTNSGTKYQVGTTYKIIIIFDKSDGSFSKMVCSDGTNEYDIDYILAEYSGLSKKVKLNKLTGKHYIE